MKTKISVAVCTYNGEKFIAEQIDSILNQTLRVDEIIVCDDCSSDNTLKILKDYESKNSNIFKIFTNSENLRSTKNFQKAISLCSGDIIFLSDQDDIWITNKVEKYLDFFTENPKINALASNGFCINEKSEIQEKYSLWDIPEFLREEKLNFDYFDIITFISNIVTGASLAFRKNILSEVLPFPEIKDFYHDEWIALLTSNKKEFEFLNEKLFCYRIHDNQQVGGIFYDKSEKVKQSFINTYDLQNNPSTFKHYKKRLKRLHISFNKYEKLCNDKNKHNSISQLNKKRIVLLFKELKSEMVRKYPLRSFFTTIIDKIKNKRQLKY